MKGFTNKSFKNIQNAEGEKATYASVIIGCLQVAPAEVPGRSQGGFTPDEMKARIKVQDILEKVDADEPIEIEDADFAKMLDCVKTTRWTKLDKEILSMIDELTKWFDTK